MANSTLNLYRDVLHVRSGPPPQVEAVDGYLAAASLDADVCGDVYRALARLCRSPSNAPRAVIVCVDGLGPPELEFFSLLSRARPDLPVYVYGHQRSESRIAKAIGLGAQGRATEEVIRSISTREPAPPAPAPGDQVEAPPKSLSQKSCGTGFPADRSVSKPVIGIGSKPTTSDTAPLVTPSIDESPIQHQGAAVTGDYGDDDEVDGGAIEGSVRVPWLRYGDKPARTAPKPPTPTAHDAPSAEQEPSVSEAHQPLLTDEELQALIGDDISAIAPDGPDADPRDEPGGGEVAP